MGFSGPVCCLIPRNWQISFLPLCKGKTPLRLRTEFPLLYNDPHGLNFVSYGLPSVIPAPMAATAELSNQLRPWNHIDLDIDENHVQRGVMHHKRHRMTGYRATLTACELPGGDSDDLSRSETILRCLPEGLMNPKGGWSELGDKKSLSGWLVTSNILSAHEILIYLYLPSLSSSCVYSTSLSFIGWGKVGFSVLRFHCLKRVTSPRFCLVFLLYIINIYSRYIFNRS